MPLSSDAPKRILCVCLGNICRSPTAEEVMRTQLAVAGIRAKVDSAGTSATHAGEPPDTRSQKFAKQRGYRIGKIRSRQVVPEDFYRFDYIFAMDADNLAHLQQIRSELPQPSQAKLVLFSEYDPDFAGQDVPDPYYGEVDGFDTVLDQIESSTQSWVDRWQVVGPNGV